MAFRDRAASGSHDARGRRAGELRRRPHHALLGSRPVGERGLVHDDHRAGLGDGDHGSRLRLHAQQRAHRLHLRLQHAPALRRARRERRPGRQAPALDDHAADPLQGPRAGRRLRLARRRHHHQLGLQRAHQPGRSRHADPAGGRRAAHLGDHGRQRDRARGRVRRGRDRQAARAGAQRRQPRQHRQRQRDLHRPRDRPPVWRGRLDARRRPDRTAEGPPREGRRLTRRTEMIDLYTPMRVTARGLVLGAALLASAVFSYAKEGDAELIAARQKFFGVENVDAITGAVSKDKVILSWLTNTTYAVSVRGRIVLLDTFATRLEVSPGRTNFVIKDIVDLKPETLFLGHGHFDHADNAAYVAAKTGAAIYASQETCEVMRFDLERMKKDPLIQGNPVSRIDPAASVSCTDVTTTGSVPGTQLVRLRALEPDVCILAFRHLHSVLVPRDPDFGANTVPVVVDRQLSEPRAARHGDVTGSAAAEGVPPGPSHHRNDRRRRLVRTAVRIAAEANEPDGSAGRPVARIPAQRVARHPLDHRPDRLRAADRLRSEAKELAPRRRQPLAQLGQAEPRAAVLQPLTKGHQCDSCKLSRPLHSRACCARPAVVIVNDPGQEPKMPRELSNQTRLSPSAARRLVRIALMSLLPIALAGVGGPADARITQIQINYRALAFGGASFGAVGQYETLRGVAFGEVDPNDPLNEVITDIKLAPRNARGLVEYNMDFWINKPVDMTKANGTLLHDVPNRGNVRSLELNVGGAADSNAGDGLLQRQGHTISDNGWEGDLSTGLQIRLPIARNRDGSEITNRIRTEYILNGAPASTQDLSTPPAYESASTSNAGATLTRRVHQDDVREPISNSDWAFADCSATPFPGVPSTKKICLKGNFDANHIYELLYTAKNPMVLGLGFAATRDFISFLRNSNGASTGHCRKERDRDGKEDDEDDDDGGDDRRHGPCPAASPIE